MPLYWWSIERAIGLLSRRFVVLLSQFRGCKDTPGRRRQRMGLPSNWRSPASAEDYANHDFADFAQEFLRRNPDYQAEYRQADEMPPTDDEPNRREAIANKWGLSFRLRSQPRSSRRPGALVSACDPRYSHAWPRAGTAFGITALPRSFTPHFLCLAVA
ncbi:transcriptional regulator domain-containing protein [Sphingomonas oligoaromativorans]|uniref:transcriptional regulator domain-containing protein n=1 Tax=Sphingomonas oligoaromativorans TaxID=575322 RepID=UPI003C7992D8